MIFRQKDLNQSYLLYIDTYMYYVYLHCYTSFLSIVNTMYIYKLLSNLHYESVDKVEANQPLYVI